MHDPQEVKFVSIAIQRDLLHNCLSKQFVRFVVRQRDRMNGKSEKQFLEMEIKREGK
jgi:hypothetical protein